MRKILHHHGTQGAPSHRGHLSVLDGSLIAALRFVMAFVTCLVANLLSGVSLALMLMKRPILLLSPPCSVPRVYSQYHDIVFCLHYWSQNHILKLCVQSPIIVIPFRYLDWGKVGRCSWSCLCNLLYGQFRRITIIHQSLWAWHSHFRIESRWGRRRVSTKKVSDIAL